MKAVENVGTVAARGDVRGLVGDRQAWFESEIAKAERLWIDRFHDRYEAGDDVLSMDHFVALWLAERTEALAAEGVQGLVADIAQQKPEKPDHWNSCSQCESNIDRAQEALAAEGVQAGEVEQRARELLKSATTDRRERVIKDQNAVVYREDAIAAIAAALTRRPVAWNVVQIGNYGAAYDPRGACRAFTYDHQPGNVDAGRLGAATVTAANASAGDSIDRGLALLKALQEEGFGVFQIGAAQPMQQGGGEVVAWHVVDEHGGLIADCTDEASAREVASRWENRTSRIRPLIYGDTAPPSAPVEVDCDCPGEGKDDPALHAPNCPARLSQQPEARGVVDVPSVDDLSRDAMAALLRSEKVYAKWSDLAADALAVAQAMRTALKGERNG